MFLTLKSLLLCICRFHYIISMPFVQVSVQKNRQHSEEYCLQNRYFLFFFVPFAAGFAFAQPFLDGEAVFLLPAPLSEERDAVPFVCGA